MMFELYGSFWIVNWRAVNSTKTQAFKKLLCSVIATYSTQLFQSSLFAANISVP